MREIGDGLDAYAGVGRVERLEAAVVELLLRIDNLEATVVALCEQDGDVQFTPVGGERNGNVSNDLGRL